MIGEGAIAIGGTIFVLRQIIGREKRDLKNKWRMSMLYANAKNHKKNYSSGKESPQTFKLLKIIKKQYGYDAIVGIPYGLSYEKLEEFKPVIETNLRCRIFFSRVRESGSAYARIVTIPFDDKEPFSIVKTHKPYELYLGRTFYQTNIVSDMRYHPHVIVSGATGTGKSFLLFQILSNLINNNTENEVNLYLAQISAKQDLKRFAKLKHTKFYANNLEKSFQMYSYLQEEMKKRNDLIFGTEGCDTIEDYNKKVGKSKKLPYIYIFADEFSYYMEDGTEQPDELQYKKMCQAQLVDFVKQGRSAGMFVIVCLQRPDKENMPPIFKSQINTRIALRQNNTASSLVVIDCGDAVDLEDREVITLFGGKLERFKTLFVSEEVLKNLLENHKVENPQYVDVSKYALKEKERKGGNKTKNTVKQNTPKQDSKDVKTLNPGVDNVKKPKKGKGVIGSVGATG